jgi:hypothetical protein
MCGWFAHLIASVPGLTIAGPLYVSETGTHWLFRDTTKDLHRRTSVWSE